MPEKTPTAGTPAVDDALMWFRTRGGATVALYPGLDWKCLGCGRDDRSLSLAYARGEANTHAGQCWSMPRPTTA